LPRKTNLDSQRSGGAFVEYWERTVPWTFKDERKTYPERRRMRYELQDYMLEAIPFGSFKGKRLLEVGSGSGIDSAEFGRNGAEVISLDFTETGTTATRDTLKEAGLASNVVRADAQKLPFRDGAFDCVYSFGVLHHVPDASRMVGEISRVMTPDGEFICMLYNKNSLLYAYSVLFLHKDEGLGEDELVSKYSERVEMCPYTKAYTQRDVRDLLQDRFRDISTSIRYNVIDTAAQRKIKAEVPDFLELGWHIIVDARNKGRTHSVASSYLT
jgi:ubiquinone/menaquinone biosynthesis C-methylase UbiE